MAFLASQGSASNGFHALEPGNRQRSLEAVHDIVTTAVIRGKGQRDHLAQPGTKRREPPPHRTMSPKTPSRWHKTGRYLRSGATGRRLGLQGLLCYLDLCSGEAPAGFDWPGPTANIGLKSARRGRFWRTWQSGPRRWAAADEPSTRICPCRRRMNPDASTGHQRSARIRAWPSAPIGRGAHPWCRQPRGSAARR